MSHIISKLLMIKTKIKLKKKASAQYDSVLSLADSSVLETDLETFISQNRNFSMIMISIDCFSHIIQTNGYTSADLILCEAAHRIRSAVDNKYKVSRYKGTDFLLLGYEAYSEEKVMIQAQNILKTLLNSYQVKDHTFHPSFNIGVYIQNECSRSENPLNSVIQAMNYSKYLGSNQVQQFDLITYKNLLRSNELQAEIISGLQQGQFFLVYQPLFCLYNNELKEIEALIRWQHPQMGLLNPNQFIEIAEQSGRIIDIDYWVLEAACKQLKEWEENHVKPAILSINISSITFEDKSFIPYLIQLFKYYDTSPALLQFELTERMVIQNMEDCINTFKKLRSLGIRIAIDDFGIGYSSLNYIIQLPIDSIKIDKSFINNITSGKEAKAIVAAIISLCKKLSLDVIAEGIETQEELDYLIENGCDIAQGFFLSKPMSVLEIESNYLSRDYYSS